MKNLKDNIMIIVLGLVLGLINAANILVGNSSEADATNALVAYHVVSTIWHQ